MNNQIKYYIKSVYGRPLMYPACEQGRNITRLTGRKTFDDSDVRAMWALGFELVEVLESQSELQEARS